MFMESWNHRMAWVEKDHNDHPVSTPCYVQGHQPPNQAAQSHIQPGLECLQGWGIHNLPGQMCEDFVQGYNRVHWAKPWRRVTTSNCKPFTSFISKSSHGRDLGVGFLFLFESP